MNKQYLSAKNLIRLVGIVLFLVIISQTDFSNINSVIIEIDPLSLLLVALFAIPIMTFKGLRWYVIAKGLNLNLKAYEAIEGLCIAQMTGFTLPGSLGDLVRVPFLKCRGNPSDISLLSIFIDAIAAAIIPYFVGLLAFIEFFDLDVSIVVAACIFTVVLITGGYAVYRLLKYVLHPWLLQVRLRRILDNGTHGRFVFNLPTSIRLVGISSFGLAVFLSGVAWFVYTLQGWFLARILMIDISWIHIAFAMTVASLVTVLPISIQGVGVREGVLLLLLGTTLDIATSSIVLFSVVLTVISLTPSIAGLISWIRDPFVKIQSSEVEDAITAPLGMTLDILNDDFV